MAHGFARPPSAGVRPALVKLMIDGGACVDGSIEATSARYGPAKFQSRLASAAHLAPRGRGPEPGGQATCPIVTRNACRPRTRAGQVAWQVLLGRDRVGLVYCHASGFSQLRPSLVCRSGRTEAFLRCLLGSNVQLRTGFRSVAHQFGDMSLRGSL